MKQLTAYCGLDCETCEARLATITNDGDLRNKVAKNWSELNGVEITPQMINCVGCRVDGVKTSYCDSLCPIRQCAKKRGFETCGSCSEMDSCKKVGAIIKNNPRAYSTLRGNKVVVTKQDLIDGLKRLGVKPGMALEVHSSLSSFGQVEGGALTVIDSIKEIVTKEGSIFMPALRLSKELPLSDEDRAMGITVKIKVLPRGEKRTAMGIVADTFRSLPDTLTGTDIISTSGWGAHGKEALTGGFDWAINNDGKALLFDVDIYKLTAMHYMEGATPKDINEMFAPSEEISKKYPPEEWFIEAGHPPVKAWYKIQKAAFERGLIKETYIGNCRVWFFDIKSVVSIYSDELKKDPYKLWGIEIG